MSVRRAPAVTELQAKLLRLVRDNGGTLSHAGVAQLWAGKILVRSCLHHRWLAPRVGPPSFVLLTDGGRAALAHYEADEKQEEIWNGARG